MIFNNQPIWSVFRAIASKIWRCNVNISVSSAGLEDDHTHLNDKSRERSVTHSFARLEWFKKSGLFVALSTDVIISLVAWHFRHHLRIHHQSNHPRHRHASQTNNIGWTIDTPIPFIDFLNSIVITRSPETSVSSLN